MEKIQELLAQINVKELIKVFNFQISLAIFLFFIIFRHLFSKIILKIIFKITKNTQKVKDSKLYKILSNYFVVLGLYLGIIFLKPKAQVLAIVNDIFKIVCIIFATSIINSFINRDAKWFRKYVKHSRNDSVNSFICKIARGIVWIISGYIILKELNIDLTGLVAGFGIGSVIISLAAQDTVKSLLSGVVILTDRPFDIGDFIEVGDFKGTVLDITFRSTRIRALNNTIVMIPNSIITSEYVVNWNKLKSRRLEFVLNLSMETTTEKIRDVVEKAKLVLKNNPDVLPETVQVNFDEISSYSSNIKIVLYINETNYDKFIVVKEKIFCSILELVEMENIDLAYPTQTIYLKNKEAIEMSIESIKKES